MTPEMTGSEIRRVRQGIKEKYDRVAAAGSGDSFRYPTGQEGLDLQGYPPEVIRGFPPEVLATFCGVGNPFSLGPLNPGDAVLDIGCGAGVDSLVAAVLVGAAGHVTGIDFTPAMIEPRPGPPGANGAYQRHLPGGGSRGPPLPGGHF